MVQFLSSTMPVDVPKGPVVSGCLATCYQDERVEGQLQNHVSQASRSLPEERRKQGRFWYQEELGVILMKEDHTTWQLQHAILLNNLRRLLTGAGCFQFCPPSFPPKVCIQSG
jgi:hypothetical protein